MIAINHRLCMTCWLCIFALTACTGMNTAPIKNYYVLENRADTPLISGQPRVSIRSVKLPNYLNQQGIARVLSNGQVNISYTDLWAEKLSHSVPTLLQENLSHTLNEPIETHPLPPGIRVSSVIEVNITRFLADEDSLQLKGNYRIVNPNRLRSYQFDLQVPLIDYQTATLVNAYAEAIKQLSTTMAKHLHKRLS